MVQTVHGKFFSRKKWELFLKSRAVPGSGVSFAEIEVILCKIPSRGETRDEELQLEREREGKYWVYSTYIHHNRLYELLSKGPGKTLILCHLYM